MFQVHLLLNCRTVVEEVSNADRGTGQLHAISVLIVQQYWGDIAAWHIVRLMQWSVLVFIVYWRVHHQEMSQKAARCPRTRRKNADLGFRRSPRRRKSNVTTGAERRYLLIPVCHYCGTLPFYSLVLTLAFCYICRLFLYFQLMWNSSSS